MIRWPTKLGPKGDPKSFHSAAKSPMMMVVVVRHAAARSTQHAARIVFTKRFTVRPTVRPTDRPTDVGRWVGG